TLWGANQSWHATLPSHQLAMLHEQSAAEEQATGGTPSYVVTPAQADYLLKKYLPANWRTAEDEIVPAEIRQLVLFGNLSGWSPRQKLESENEWPPASWQRQEKVVELGGNRLLRMSARAEPFEASAPFPGQVPIVVVWYPGADRLTEQSERVLQHADSFG